MAISKGDKIHWNTSQGTTHGEPVEKKTKEFHLRRAEVQRLRLRALLDRRASKTDKQAAHKESSLS